MAMNISKNTLEKLKDSAERAKQKYAGAIKKGEEIVESVVHTAEVSMAAFGFGVLDGRYGGVEVVGVPLSLLAGAGGHVAGFFLQGKAAPHLHGFADGAMAAFAHKLGHGTGKEWRQGAKEPALPGDNYTVAGEMDEGSSGSNGRRSIEAGQTSRGFASDGVRDPDLAKLVNQAAQGAQR